jgi:hypothetical protein
MRSSKTKGGQFINASGEKTDPRAMSRKRSLGRDADAR